MNFALVTVQAEPMLFVSGKAVLNSDNIPSLVGGAFARLDAFLTWKGIAPTGPPLAIYRGAEAGLVNLELGFPVSHHDAGRAEGEVRSGQTPSGRALKTLHYGAYVDLPETYRLLEAHLAEAGLLTSGEAWEIYYGEQATTPTEDLVTAVHLALR